MAGGLITALRQGMGSVLNTFRRSYTDPSQVEGGAALGLQPAYRHLWELYENSAFENIGAWGPYKGQYRLYRQMRMIYNPTKRLVEFYATHIYPGLLTADPSQLPEGTRLAMPLAEDTDPAILPALDQLWAWSKWQANKAVLCRYGAVAGNVLVEAVDDYEASRVYMHIVWPSLITYLDLDPTGVILAYVLQYPARDDNGTYYEYRKEVDTDEIRFYRDSMPWDYGEGTSYPNPYGFVPAVWVKHKDLGGNNGAPAIHGSIGKVDELNSLASHIHDQIHKVIGAPQVIWSDGTVGSLFNTTAQTPRAPSNPYDTTNIDREGLLILKGQAGGRVDSLAGQLQLHEALEHLTMLQTEIEADHPEVAMYRELRQMSQVTGPAATRLMGDVVLAVDEAASNYDAGCVQLFAMCMAIGGWRVNSGDWASMGTEQALFRPFNLDQYSSGALHVRILPRPLIGMSEEEMLQLQQLRDSTKAGVAATLTANLREAVPT